MAKKAKIKILPGGPYQVTGEVPLKQAVIGIDQNGTSEEWQEGPVYHTGEEESYCLCRCGHSKNKPFCDGAHEHVAFNDEETADKTPYEERCKVYHGEAVDLYDDESLCAQMRFCDRGKGVWQAAIDSADPASRQLAIEESCACAAGRLTVRDNKTGEFIEEKLPQEISPIEDTAAGQRGPLWVKGGITLEGADGETYEVRNRMTLCRCGESNNMPFCDISHRVCTHMQGFDDPPKE